MYFIGFGAMDVTKPYEFIGFGAMDVTRPYEFIRFGAMDVTKPYEFIGFAAKYKGPLKRLSCSTASPPVGHGTLSVPDGGTPSRTERLAPDRPCFNMVTVPWAPNPINL